LRTNFGTKITEDEHAFPTIQQMEKATEAKLRELGFGYRAGYITSSV
jgi:3-methyladenine DNA glycosylase/8-oxoguanine DNA glycosylase